MTLDPPRLLSSHSHETHDSVRMTIPKRTRAGDRTLIGQDLPPRDNPGAERIHPRHVAGAVARLAVVDKRHIITVEAPHVRYRSPSSVRARGSHENVMIDVSDASGTSGISR